jgi:hypothetical protein
MRDSVRKKDICAYRPKKKVTNAAVVDRFKKMRDHKY